MLDLTLLLISACNDHNRNALHSVECVLPLKLEEFFRGHKLGFLPLCHDAQM